MPIGSKTKKKLQTLKRYKVGLSGSTIPLSERYAADSCIGYLVPYYFQVFKAWASASHENIKEWYECQFPKLYKSTLHGYTTGAYRIVSLNRLFIYFSYFRYNKSICDKLLSNGCDITSLDFFSFLQLRDIPMPESEYITIDYDIYNLIPRKYIQVSDNQIDTD